MDRYVVAPGGWLEDAVTTTKLGAAPSAPPFGLWRRV